MTGFLGGNDVESCIFEEKQQKRTKKGGVSRPFSPKSGSMRSA
jgi:hypothetical protein